VVTGDLAGLAGMRQVAEQADAAGPFDAVIHNAGVGHRDPAHRVTTEDGLCLVFAVNVLAPYLLTALMERPRRLIYLSSGLHRDADASLGDAQWEAANGTGGYFFHQQPQETHPAARDVTVQDELLRYCAGLAGVELPA
jgi:NAD(P)-dependent dehydrogenase (short-subunit alcohol dehydrogenase family)